MPRMMTADVEFIDTDFLQHLKIEALLYNYSKSELSSLNPQI